MITFLFVAIFLNFTTVFAPKILDLLVLVNQHLLCFGARLGKVREQILQLVFQLDDVLLLLSTLGVLLIILSLLFLE